MEPELLTIESVARLIGVSRSRAYQMAATGSLPAVYLGRSVRVPKAAFAEWLSQLPGRTPRSSTAVEEAGGTGDPTQEA